MNTTTKTITTIEKEQLDNIHFPQQEVLLDIEKIKHRRSEAQRAMMVGNTLKNKVKIVFEDTAGLKMVETTIWGVTDKYLMLKSGVSLPIHRVHEIIT